MSVPPMETVLGLLAAIPAGVAIASGVKDGATKGICVALMVLGLVLAVSPVIDPIEDVVKAWRLAIPLALALGVLGIIGAVRIQNRIIGTLLVTSGVIAAAKAIGLIGGWAYY